MEELDEVNWILNPAKQGDNLNASEAIKKYNH